MPGLRFFACNRCDTVYADLEAPPQCSGCPHSQFEEITQSVQAEPYFAPSIDDTR